MPACSTSAIRHFR